MRKFNIEEAKAGKPVCTRDGRPVRVLCYDRLGAFPVVALVKDGDEVENTQCFTTNGFYYVGRESDTDLMMKPTKRTGFINIYTSIRGGLVHEFKVYNTREEAEQNKSLINFVATAKIEWEE